MAYTQSTPIFIGGRYHIAQPQEIALNPNSDNYIYVKSDISGNIIFEVRQQKAYIEEENSFNAICIAKITTNETDPISTIYWP